MSEAELAGHHLKNALRHLRIKQGRVTNFLDTVYPLERTYRFFESIFSLPDETEIQIIEGYDGLCKGWSDGRKCSDYSIKGGKCIVPKNNPDSIAEYNREIADFFGLPIGMHTVGEIKEKLG